MAATRSSILAGTLLAASVAAAWANESIVYRCLDEYQRPQYTNVKSETNGRNCVIVTREVSVVPATGAAKPSAPAPQSAAPSTTARSPASSGSSAGFPRVDAQTQKGRDDSRRKVLEDELSLEQRALAKARDDLNEQEKVRFGDERNYQKVLDRLKPYQDTVDRHERNIDALRKELSNLK